MNSDVVGMLMYFTFTGMALALGVIGVRALRRRWIALGESRADSGNSDGRPLALGSPDVTLEEFEVQGRHVAELEERLDFAERLLAQRHDVPAVPLHRTPI